LHLFFSSFSIELSAFNFSNLSTFSFELSAHQVSCILHPVCLPVMHTLSQSKGLSCLS